MTPRVFSEIIALRAALDAARGQNRTVGVVPTMGALHAGHLSLVEEARRRADLVVVTIFVNPTQFGPHEDFAKYPRDLQRDLALLASAEANIVFAPSVKEMYPPGEQTRVRVAELSEGLCGAHRPGHFEGVATIVAKLFNAVGSGVYLFGRKDYQQWRVIERLALDLMFPVTVVGCPVVREPDGLAMSSRNTYLSAAERTVAPRLAAGLAAAKQEYQAGERRVDTLLEAARAVILPATSGGPSLQLEYLELRHSHTLAPLTADGGRLPDEAREEWVLLAAARLGTTRLIDNIEF
jgi:pantoate--beta-alanine ligase